MSAPFKRAKLQVSTVTIMSQVVGENSTKTPQLPCTCDSQWHIMCHLTKFSGPLHGKNLYTVTIILPHRHTFTVSRVDMRILAMHGKIKDLNSCIQLRLFDFVYKYYTSWLIEQANGPCDVCAQSMHRAPCCAVFQDFRSI